MFPFGILNGLCTGHEVRGPHLEGPGNGTGVLQLKLLELHGLQRGGGSCGPCNEVIDGPCVNIGGPGNPPGPGPWKHIGPPQLGIGHWPPIFISPQYGSTVKLSWLPEHSGGEDCLE